MKKFVRRIFLPLLVAAVLLFGARFLLLGHFKLPTTSDEGNAHALVSLTYYGLRLPGENLWGFHRLGFRVPARGELIVYKPLGEKEAKAGICEALPGDTLWAVPDEKKILPTRTSSEAQAFVIPTKKFLVSTSPGTYALIPHEELVGKVIYLFNPNLLSYEK